MKVPARKTKKRSNLIIWLITGAVVLIVIYLLLLPARTSGASKYIASGDKLLSERKFVSAIVEYRKAEFLAESKEAAGRIALARDGEKDIMKLEPFFREVNAIDALNELSKANVVPETEYDGVVAAKKYIEAGRPDLSILAAGTAVEMDANYTDAWLYLGLGNYGMLREAEVSSEARDFYKDKALEALNRAKTLDPTNENVNKYLELLN